MPSAAVDRIGRGTGSGWRAIVDGWRGNRPSICLRCRKTVVDLYRVPRLPGIEPAGPKSAGFSLALAVGPRPLPFPRFAPGTFHEGQIVLSSQDETLWNGRATEKRPRYPGRLASCRAAFLLGN